MSYVDYGLEDRHANVRDYFSLHETGFIIWLVFLCLRCTGVVTWDWFWIWFPLWLPWAITLGALLVIFIIAFIASLVSASAKKRAVKKRLKEIDEQ